MSSRLIVGLKRDIANRSIVDTSGANSIFGTLGSRALPYSRYSFIPEDNKGNVISLGDAGDGGSKPVWIGLDSKIMQFWAYAFCSPLGGVIDRLAEADTNGIIRFVDAEKPNRVINVNKNPRLKRIKERFIRPNPWQTWEQFEGEQVVLSKIFGYCPVFAVSPFDGDKSYVSALFNLNPVFANPVINEGVSLYKDSPLIKEWELNIRGEIKTISSSDVFVVTDGWISKDNNGLPMSKIYGMDFFVSNIIAAMEADNVLLKKKGPLGVFSFDPKSDMAGTTPLDPSAKDDLQKDLLRYGLTVGQIQYVISKMPLKWNAMSFNVRDLMTKETIRTGIDGICDRFGYPAELMSGKNATYENRNSSEKWLYNNNIIPFSLRRMVVYNRFFGLEDVILQKSYNHLPVLQEDIVKAGEASNQEANALLIEWENNMITWNEWQIARGREPKAEMDIYYFEYKTKFKITDETSSKNTSTKE